MSNHTNESTVQVTNERIVMKKNTQARTACSVPTPQSLASVSSEIYHSFSHRGEQTVAEWLTKQNRNLAYYTPTGHTPWDSRRFAIAVAIAKGGKGVSRTVMNHVDAADSFSAKAWIVSRSLQRESFWGSLAGSGIGIGAFFVTARVGVEPMKAGAVKVAVLSKATWVYLVGLVGLPGLLAIAAGLGIATVIVARTAWGRKASKWIGKKLKGNRYATGGSYARALWVHLEKLVVCDYIDNSTPPARIGKKAWGSETWEHIADRASDEWVEKMNEEDGPIEPWTPDTPPPTSAQVFAPDLEEQVAEAAKAEPEVKPKAEPEVKTEDGTPMTTTPHTPPVEDEEKLAELRDRQEAALIAKYTPSTDPEMVRITEEAKAEVAERNRIAEEMEIEATKAEIDAEKDPEELRREVELLEADEHRERLLQAEADEVAKRMAEKAEAKKERMRIAQESNPLISYLAQFDDHEIVGVHQWVELVQHILEQAADGFAPWDPQVLSEATYRGVEDISLEQCEHALVWMRELLHKLVAEKGAVPTDVQNPFSDAPPVSKPQAATA